MIKLSLSKRHSNDFYLTEVKTGSTWFSTFHIIDAMAMNRSWKNPKITMYEVKVNRGDFLRDQKYLNYLPYCNEFYFACTPDLIARDETGEGVGLIYSNGKSNRIIKKALYREQEIPAEIFQYIIMNRIGEPQYPFYNDRIEYFQAWLERKKTCREIGYKVKSKIIGRLSELEDMEEKYNRMKSEYETINQTLLDHGSNSWDGNIVQKLDKLFQQEKIHNFNPTAFRNTLKNVNEKIADMLQSIESQQSTIKGEDFHK
jgi:hypothetical protein